MTPSNPAKDDLNRASSVTPVHGPPTQHAFFCLKHRSFCMSRYVPDPTTIKPIACWHSNGKIFSPTALVGRRPAPALRPPPSPRIALLPTETCWRRKITSPEALSGGGCTSQVLRGGGKKKINRLHDGGKEGTGRHQFTTAKYRQNKRVRVCLRTRKARTTVVLQARQ